MPRELPTKADEARQARSFQLNRMVDLDIGQGSIGHIVIHAGNKAMTRPASPDFSSFTLYAFMGSFGRPPQTSEQTTWVDALTTAYGSSLAALIAEATTLIRGQFEDAEYAARDRTNSQFLYDLYATYLDRLPDIEGYEFWLPQLDTGRPRSELLDAFDTALEYVDRVTTMTMPTLYPGDLRNIGTWTMVDGASADQGGFELQTIESQRSAVVGGVLEKSVVKNFLPTVLADPTQRIHPAPATLFAVIEFTDGTFWVDPYVIGFADISSANAETAKLNVTSDIARDDLDVVLLCSQRCSHDYKGPGCDSPDPSPTCSRIFDDDVNGCASKMPAPQITDPAVTNNQPSFAGVPPMKVQKPASSVGVNGFPVGGYLDPNDPILHRRPFDDSGVGNGRLMI